MVGSQKNNLKLGMLLGVLLALTACSSSKVGKSAAPVETAADAMNSPDATTDAVPAPDQLAGQPAAPDALDATPSAPDAQASAPKESAALEVAPSEPVADIPAAPITEESEKMAAVDGEATQYKVKKGDTLMKIAFENYGDLYRWKEIYDANKDHVMDPNHVPPGTMLTLNGAGMVTIDRNGDRYLIKHGDTLGLISQDVYGTTKKWKKLWENNRQLIKDPNKIYAGFYLFYQPEARLTHDGMDATDPAASAPAVLDNGGSASNTSQTLKAGKTVANNIATPVPTQVNGAAQPVDMSRTPASNH